MMNVYERRRVVIHTRFNIVSRTLSTPCHCCQTVVYIMIVCLVSLKNIQSLSSPLLFLHHTLWVDWNDTIQKTMNEWINEWMNVQACEVRRVCLSLLLRNYECIIYINRKVWLFSVYSTLWTFFVFYCHYHNDFHFSFSHQCLAFVVIVGVYL